MASQRGSESRGASDPRKAQAARIIHRSARKSAWLAGLLAQGAIVGLDTLALTPVTVKMIGSIAGLFGKRYQDLPASPGLITAGGTALAAGLARDALSLVPPVGNLANAAITYAATLSIGWAVYRSFERELSTSPDREPE